MIERITSIEEESLKEISQKIGHAFCTFDYTKPNKGMTSCLNEDQFSMLIYGQIKAAYLSGNLYTCNHKGYLILSTPKNKSTLKADLVQAYWMFRAFGVWGYLKQASKLFQAGPFQTEQMIYAHQPFVLVEMIVVLNEFQHQGVMSEMMKYAIDTSQKLKLPCILSTDDPKKVEIYKHFGFVVKDVFMISLDYVHYDMIRRIDNEVTESKN